MTGSRDRDDADDDLDEGLRPMRAVWLEMRTADEDPPAGGMAALLAAAREKAQQMKPPTLWERFVGTLRRPPVLAFAGIAVLISGAIVVGNRREAMMAPAHDPPPAQTQPTTFAPNTDPTVAPTDKQAAGSAIQAPPAVVPEKPAVTPHRPRPHGHAPAKQDGFSMKPEGTKSPETKEDSGTALEESTVGGQGAPATDATEGTTAKPTPQTNQATKSDAPASTTDQLKQESESAAARGDCAAVKRTAQKLDRAARDSLAAKNAAVARCLR